MGSLVDPPRGSTDEVRALPAFRTNGTVISHGARHPTSVGFDTQAEVDLDSINLVAATSWPSKPTAPTRFASNLLTITGKSLLPYVLTSQSSECLTSRKSY